MASLCLYQTPHAPTAGIRSQESHQCYIDVFKKDFTKLTTDNFFDFSLLCGGQFTVKYIMNQNPETKICNRERNHLSQLYFFFLAVSFKTTGPCFSVVFFLVSSVSNRCPVNLQQGRRGITEI